MIEQNEQNGNASNGTQVDPTFVIQSLKRQAAEAAARTGEEIALRDALIEQLGAENKKLRETIDTMADKAGADETNKADGVDRADRGRSPRLVEATTTAAADA